MEKERKDFREMFSYYRVNEDRLKKLQKRFQNPPYPKGTEYEIEFTKQYLDNVNKVLDQIKTYCGQEAVDVFTEVYIDKLGVENVAAMRGISRRKLEAFLTAWTNKYFSAINVKTATREESSQLPGTKVPGL